MSMRLAAFVISLLSISCAGGKGTGVVPGPTPGGGGRALMVVGTIPLVGTDVQIRDALKARNLEVDEVLEAMAAPRDAEGKQVVVLSFSMLSKSFKASFADLAVPVIVMEHNLLPGLGMTAADGHGYQPGLTHLEILSDDPLLTAGLPKGEVAVHLREQQMFWGIPGPGAIKVATAKGHPDRPVFFAYPAGAMMVGKVAPAKRLHFFFAVHAPPPVTTLYLNDNGLRLLGATIDWSLQ